MKPTMFENTRKRCAEILAEPRYLEDVRAVWRLILETVEVVEAKAKAEAEQKAKGTN
jgi:hypothetical protein